MWNYGFGWEDNENKEHDTGYSSTEVFWAFFFFLFFFCEGELGEESTIYVKLILW